MPKLITWIVAFVAATAIAAPVAAFADGEANPPASDAMATQGPQAYSTFMTRPCTTPRSVNCYRDVIGKTGRAGWSYWVIRVGHKVCVRYWEPAYDRKHGHCMSARAYARR